MAFECLTKPQPYIQGYPGEVARWMKSLKHRQHNWLQLIRPH
jgi:hypothetical protein